MVMFIAGGSSFLEKPPLVSLRQRLFSDAEAIQAGAWLRAFFAYSSLNRLVAPFSPEPHQDPLNDIPVPAWPSPGDPKRTTLLLGEFVAAGLLEGDETHGFRRTRLGEALLPVFEMLSWSVGEQLPNRFPDLASAVAGQRVLDLGCGTGAYTLMLNDLGPQSLIALDYSERMLMSVRALVEYLRLPCPVLRGSIETLPFEDESFDFIFCRGVLPLVHHGRSLAEIARTLAPGGRCVLMLHSPHYYLRRMAHAGMQRERVRYLVAGALGLLGGAAMDLGLTEPQWQLFAGPFYLAYERKASFGRVAAAAGLQLDQWAAGYKPFAWISKPH